MHRQPLLSLLADYTPSVGEENAMWQSVKEFVALQPRCFERTLTIGHVTGSAWIVSPDRSVVLLMHHAKLNRWFQPGGHCDGDPKVLAVALKEAQEETGIAQLSPVSQAIFDIDVHLIPSRGNEPEHLHYDIRFLFEADPSASIQNNAESKEVRWIPLEKVARFNDSESILRMVRKTTSFFNS